MGKHSLLFRWWVQDSYVEHAQHTEMVCGQQGSNEAICGFVLWWSCALLLMVMLLRGLEEKTTLTIQRYVILDA